MAQFASDSFSGTDGTLLSTYSANWVKHSSSGAGTLLIYSDRARKNEGGDEALYYHSGTPGGADYSVTSLIACVSSASGNPGVCGRINTAANTFYMARYDTASGGWQLFKRVTGTFTQLGSTSTQTFASGSKEIKLKMVGSAIELFKEGGGSATISATDSAITAAGKAGLRASAAATDTTSYHFENFSADDISGGATITGTFSGTDSVDTTSFAGDVLIQGTLAATDATDTTSFSGAVPISGTFSPTESAVDSAAFSGSVATAGIPTLSSPTVVSVTATTAVPRVTVTFA